MRYEYAKHFLIHQPVRSRSSSDSFPSSSLKLLKPGAITNKEKEVKEDERKKTYSASPRTSLSFGVE